MSMISLSLEMLRSNSDSVREQMCTLTLEELEEILEKIRSINRNVGAQQRRVEDLCRRWSCSSTGTATRIPNRESCVCAQPLSCNCVQEPSYTRRRRVLDDCMEVYLPSGVRERQGGNNLKASHGLETLRRRMPRARAPLQVQDELQSVHDVAKLQMMHKGPTARRRPNSVVNQSHKRLGHTIIGRTTIWFVNETKARWSRVTEELDDIFTNPLLTWEISKYIKIKKE